MQINIKDKLRSLRTQKNVTQEALANHLSITPQSVGKWERGEGFPDITLLPNIALYFGITVDELLCVDNARIDEKIEAYNTESRKLLNKGETEANLELWERANAEFPSDCRVMKGLMYALITGCMYPHPEENNRRAIEIGKRILDESTDTAIRESAVQCLCLAYKELGDNENALKYADMGGNFHTCSASLRCHVLDGEEGYMECQRYIESLIHNAALEAASMTAKIKLSPEEKIRHFRFGIDIINRLFDDGNIGFHNHDQSWRCSLIAYEYAQLHDADNTIEALKESVKYAIAGSTQKDGPYTAALVNRLKNEPSKTTRNYKGNECSLRLEDFEHTAFDFIRDDERFKDLKAQLEKYAE